MSIFALDRASSKKLGAFIGPSERLRRNAGEAQRNNVFSNWRQHYMRSIRPWQPSTAYVLGSMVVNGGNLYVCAAAGTSATTGGPTGTNGVNIVTDNTVFWWFYGVNAMTSEPGLTQNAWAATTAYTLGTQVINGGSVYAVVVAGTSAGSGGPTGTGNAIVDSGVTWTYMGPVTTNQYAYTFPTYTFTGTSLPSGITNLYLPGQGANLFAKRVFLAAGGTGYVVGDTINVKGGSGAGTFTTQAQLEVTSVSGGVITGLKIITPGVYTQLPISASSQGIMVQDTTSGVGTGATFYIDWTYPTWYKIRGGYCAGGTTNTAFVSVHTFQPTAGTVPITQSIAQEFYSDAQQIAIALGTNSYDGFSLIIDGVRFNQDALDVPGNNPNWYSFDFTKTTGRKIRHYRLEFSGSAATNNQNLCRVAVDSSSHIWAPDDHDATTAVLISDSIWAGSSAGPFVLGNRIAHRFSHELGWKSVFDMTQGGTGWINRGSAAGVTTDNYVYRIPEAVSLNPDIICFMGSTNDTGTSSATITAAVTAALQQLRTLGYTGIIVVFGVWPVAASHLATEDAVAAGVAAFNDPIGKTFFIPLYRRPYLPIITGTWNNNPAPSGITQTTSTNASQYIFSSDSTHPSDVGTRYQAERLIVDLKEKVLPVL